MQSVINTVKGTALGVAEYLTPVLKVGSNSILQIIVSLVSILRVYFNKSIDFYFKK